VARWWPSTGRRRWSSRRAPGSATASTSTSPTCSSSSSTGRSTRSCRPPPSTIGDHDRLFARLLGALVPGGRLAAQCGAAGNVEALDVAARAVGAREPFADALAGWPGPWTFASPAQTEARLRRLGWVDVWTWSHRVLVEPEDPHEYLGTVALGSHLERLNESLREPFVEAVLAEVGEPVVEYVRLNILARRPS
jgi:trans-aconitate 2-methyltransferase